MLYKKLMCKIIRVSSYSLILPLFVSILVSLWKAFFFVAEYLFCIFKKVFL